MPFFPTGTTRSCRTKIGINFCTRAKKEYLRLFPSLNASYNLRENLIARASVYQSVGRPNFVQYSGGVLRCLKRI